MKTESFGTTAGGVKATLYTLENKNHTVVKVTDLGATLVSVLYADKEGKLCDMVIGLVGGLIFLIAGIILLNNSRKTRQHREGEN